MGMYDTIENVLVKCPRCGNTGPKSVQIKCGPQTMEIYVFGKDRVDVNWSYEYYESIVDRDNHIIGGIATCDNCREELNRKMEYIIAEANRKGEIERPDGAEYLFDCKIGGKNAFCVILNRLDEAYSGNKDISSFHVAIRLKNDVAISAKVL